LNWAYDAHAQCYPFDLAVAAKQLQADGWIMGSDGLRHKNGRTLRFGFAGNTGNPGLDTTVLLIQQWFKKIGAGLEYVRYPTDKLFASYAAGGIAATRHYDLTSYAWSLAPDPDLTNIIACSRISPVGQNYTGYCNRDVDAALQDALVNYDRTMRKRDYIRVQEELARDVPFIVLSQRTDYVTYNDDFRNIRPGPAMKFWNPQDISNSPQSPLR
jgi:peptide/nickel transport system substrate-binding protein